MSRYNPLTRALTATAPTAAPPKRRRPAAAAAAPVPRPPITPVNGAGLQVLAIPAATFGFLAECEGAAAERLREEFAAYCACIPGKGFDWRRSWEAFRGQPRHVVAAVTTPVPIAAVALSPRVKAARNFFATL